RLRRSRHGNTVRHPPRTDKGPLHADFRTTAPLAGRRVLRLPCDWACLESQFGSPDNARRSGPYRAVLTPGTCDHRSGRCGRSLPVRIGRISWLPPLCLGRTREGNLTASRPVILQAATHVVETEARL